MPLATKEEVARWGFDTDGFDTWVYLSDCMLWKTRTESGLTLEDAMRQEIQALSLDPKDFATYDVGRLAQRSDVALIYVASHKGLNYEAATKRRVAKLVELLKKLGASEEET